MFPENLMDAPAYSQIIVQIPNLQPNRLCRVNTVQQPTDANVVLIRKPYNDIVIARYVPTVISIGRKSPLFQVVSNESTVAKMHHAGDRTNKSHTGSGTKASDRTLAPGKPETGNPELKALTPKFKTESHTTTSRAAPEPPAVGFQGQASGLGLRASGLESGFLIWVSRELPLQYPYSNPLETLKDPFNKETL